MFWEGNFTLDEFTSVNMKNGVCRNVRKHREIKGSDKCITLDILLNFGSLDKIRMTSSEPKESFGRSGNVLITSLGIKYKARPKICKNSRYSIENVSMKDLSKITREFEKSPYKSYEK